MGFKRTLQATLCMDSIYSDAQTRKEKSPPQTSPVYVSNIYDPGESFELHAVPSQSSRIFSTTFKLVSPIIRVQVITRVLGCVLGVQ